MTTWASAGTVADTPTERNLRILRKRGGELERTTVGPVACLSPDNTASHNQKILDGAAGRRPVYAPAGVYEVRFTLPSHTALFGAGRQTVFKVPASFSEPYALVNEDQTNGNTDIHLSNFAVDGNKANSGETSSGQIIITSQGAAVSTDITVEDIYAYNGKSQGIIFVNVQGGAVRRNFVVGNDRDGITLYFNCQQIEVSGNRCVACNDDSIALNAENGKSEGHVLQDVSVHGNTIIGPAPNKGSYGAISCLGIRSCSIVGNVIDSPKERGISLLDYNTTPVGDVLVANNVIKNAGLNGESSFRPAIGLYAGLLGKAGINDVTIIGNHVREPATHGIYMQNDIAAVDGVQQVNVIGNFIDRAGLDGIRLNDSVMRDISVIGNVSHDNAGSGIVGRTFTSQLQRLRVNENTTFNNGESGIWLEGIAGCAVIGNSSSNQAAGTPQAYGLRIATPGARWHIADNVAFNNATKDYEFTTFGGANFRDGFFGTSPIAKPTGVAKTAEGVWKALNELGLIS